MHIQLIVVVLSIFMFGRVFPAQNPGSDLQTQILSARNRVMPSLVHIEPVKSYYSTGERRHAVVTGSGFIFSSEGYILTNHHVIENAEKVECTLSDKSKLPARIIGSDASTDVAVLQLLIDQRSDLDLSAAPLGNSDSAEVGQFVLALGSPLGLSRSVSMGVISSIDRYFEDTGSMISPYNLWIQTDAAINPGNSGGPLINLNGEVVGINSRGVFLAENLGFAIPINLAREVAQKLMAGRHIRRSWIGLQFQPIKDLREYLDIPDLKGVLISSLDLQSPAADAGLQPGDVLLSINQRPVNADYEEDLPAIRKIIADLPPNQTLKMEIWRNRRTRTVGLKTALEPFEELPEYEGRQWGLVAKSISREIYLAHNLPDYQGVLISGVKNGEAAEQAGLQPGDVLRSVNKRSIKNLEDFKEVYNQFSKKGNQPVYLELLRNGAPYFAVLKFNRTLVSPN